MIPNIVTRCNDFEIFGNFSVEHFSDILSCPVQTTAIGKVLELNSTSFPSRMLHENLQMYHDRHAFKHTCKLHLVCYTQQIGSAFLSLTV